MKKTSRSREHPSRTNPDWTATMIAAAQPASKVLPKIFDTLTAAAMLKPRSRQKPPNSA